MVERHLWCQWGDFQGATRGVSQNKERVQKDRRTETATFLLQGFCLIAGLVRFPTVYHQMPRHVSNSEAKVGWERGGQLLGRAPGGDHRLEWHL